MILFVQLLFLSLNLFYKVRSGMLRAMAKLVVISDIKDTNVEMVEKHFDVIEFPDIATFDDSD